MKVLIVRSSHKNSSSSSRRRRRRRRRKKKKKEKSKEIEAVRIFKYLGTVINNTSDETEETNARILAANKAYSSLQTVFRSKQIHRNCKTRLYKTSVKPVMLWRSNLDPNTNGRTNVMYITMCLLDRASL